MSYQPKLCALILISWSLTHVCFAGTDPFKLVTKAYASQVSFNGAAVVSRKMPNNGGQEVYKLEFNKSRQEIRVTFVHPSSLQGLTIIDNLKTKRVFIARRNLIINEPSPFLDSLSDESRKSLMKKNYWAKHVGTGTILGRKANRVDLKPRHSELFRREIWIDTSTDFLLKQSLEDKAKNSYEFLKTVSLDVSSDSPPSFQFDSNSETEQRDAISTKRVDNPVQFRVLTGMSIQSQVKLPYGFVELSRRVVARAGGGFSVVRVLVSDGISEAFVWLWMTLGNEGREDLKLNGTKVPVFGKDQYGVSAYAQGDVPNFALEQIARDYLKNR